jgi:hypothetical protein
MKITLSLSQFKKVLKSEPVKFPVSFRGENFTNQELKEFQKVLQKAEERGQNLVFLLVNNWKPGNINFFLCNPKMPGTFAV